MALTLSRLPTMGVRGAYRNLYFALGYSGHGITLSNLAGQVLTDLYSGADEDGAGFPSTSRGFATSLRSPSGSSVITRTRA